MPSSSLNGHSSSSDKVQNQSQNLSRGGPSNLQLLDAQPEIISKCSKTSVNGEEIDEKAKNPVVQQKGRFKVTSESVEMEKVVPAPILQKSHSMQVIAQLPAVSSPLPSDATPSNAFGHAIFSHLQNVLLTNTLQRDGILSVMKQVAVGDFSDIGCMPMNMAMTEKSLLEAAHEREKELVREITDLQWRLVRAQEELQKYKTENHG